ncbi:MAG: hypothetical protein KC636_38000, partial [Myxococcales bacterium]|nr:hypothetical protein [Myxococcales bacterium]
LPAYALRRRLAASRFNNQLLACFLAGNALLILNRLVSVIVGSSGPVALAHEIAALTSLALFAALVVARWLVWSALIGVVGTLGAALWLEHASEIYTAAGSLMVVVAGLLSRRHGVDGAGR